MYYIPKIEEFHVGFVFESLERTSIDGDFKWTKLAYMQEDISSHSTQFSSLEYFYNRIESETVRVKSLDKEDIESLGWAEVEIGYGPGWLMFHKGEYGLFFGSDCKVKIEGSGPFDERVWFDGTIKNKSELSMIMEMVGITKK